MFFTCWCCLTHLLMKSQKNFFYFIIFVAVTTIQVQIVDGHSIRIEEELGTEKNISFITCVICGPGSYSGVFSVEGKPFNCTQYCPLGSCPIGINCSLCSTGTYNDQYNCTSCKSCGPGKVALQGSLNCTSCEPGSTNNSISSECVYCSPGSWSANPTLPCQPCAAGYYTPNVGSTKCSECVPGSYNPISGQPVCYPCGTGKYNPSSRSTSITACLVCPGGYYCPRMTTSTPEPCPSDHYCPAGTSQPSSCPLLFQSGRSSETCQPKATLYLLLLGGVAALVVIVAVVVCVRAGRVKAGPESKSKQPTESDRLIPQPRDGPVYEGL